MWIHLLFLVHIITVVVVSSSSNGNSSSSNASSSSSLPKLYVDPSSGAFVDPAGRRVTLRGINAVVKQFPWQDHWMFFLLFCFFLVSQNCDPEL